MAKHNIERAIKELSTATPSTALDGRIRHARGAAPAAEASSRPSRLGWPAIFGLGMGLAGFGIGFTVALSLGGERGPADATEVPVRWVSERVDKGAFDFTQQPDRPFGRYFDRADTTQGVQQ